MPLAMVNGTELFYEVDGDGAPCVVLHGGLGVDHTLYRRSLGPLSPPLQLICVDHRCNGRSGRAGSEGAPVEMTFLWTARYDAGKLLEAHIFPDDASTTR